jgi:alpha-tubulin suppressor-like RCC1 family protein
MPVSSVTAKSIALGIEHTCIVTLTDSVQCWGSNSKGQLGQSANIIQSYLPQSPVLGLKAKSIKSGYNHLCAIDFDNSVYCWGDNQYGQLGNGTYLDSNAIVSAIGLTGVQQLGLGAYHSCAATTAGISCWGRNDTDQLGSNSGTLSLNVPTQTAASRANVKQLVAGLSHSCALSGNTAECWGGNSSKQLSGNSVGGIAFIGVVFNSNPSSLSAGLNHTCAQSIDNLTYCWGAGTLGRLGPNVNSDSDIPVLVP